jgi:transcriptional regulator with XRE-family HTH domain
MPRTPRRPRTNEDVEAGTLLRAARVRAGVSVAQAAEAGEVTSDMIFRYERGTSWPPYPTLASLAARYGIGVGDFFPHSGTSAAEEITAPLFAAMAGMTLDEQNEMLSVLTSQVRMMRSWSRLPTSRPQDGPREDRTSLPL